MNSSPCRLWSKSKIKTRNDMLHSYHLIQFWLKALLKLTKNLKKRTQTVKNTKRWSWLIGMSTSPCRPWSQSKIKTIGHAIICHILIISCNSHVSYSMTCPQFSRKGANLLKLEHILINFSTPFFQPRPQSKIKTIRN